MSFSSLLGPFSQKCHHFVNFGENVGGDQGLRHYREFKKKGLIAFGRISRYAQYPQ